MTILALAVAGCGEADDPVEQLSEEEREGLRIVEEKGCQSCHGAGGRGGAGPAWIDLAGSEVELDDGSVVIADRDYLVRAILDPAAERVVGYNLQMPPNDLTEVEATAVAAYIEGR